MRLALLHALEPSVAKMPPCANSCVHGLADDDILTHEKGGEKGVRRRHARHAGTRGRKGRRTSSRASRSGPCSWPVAARSARRPRQRPRAREAQRLLAHLVPAEHASCGEDESKDARTQAHTTRQHARTHKPAASTTKSRSRLRGTQATSWLHARKTAGAAVSGGNHSLAQSRTCHIPAVATHPSSRRPARSSTPPATRHCTAPAGPCP